MQFGDGKRNGSGTMMKSVGRSALPPPPPPPPPAAIIDLAEGCVRHVEKALGVKLDYQPETLPLLDHYVVQSREQVRERPEMLSLIAQTSGAYLGEVLRRRYASWWRTEGDDPAEWRVEFESVFLAFSPVKCVLTALQRAVTERGPNAEDAREAEADADADEETEAETEAAAEADAEAAAVRAETEAEPELEGNADLADIEIEEDDRADVAARLAELPSVSEEEFYAPSTRIEVIDIAVEAIRARRMALGEDVDDMLRPEDYERDA